jgi:hypothetical protein
MKKLLVKPIYNSQGIPAQSCYRLNANNDSVHKNNHFRSTESNTT